ncbi:hypothetical protein BH11ARM1_BH11ARM1_05070 [soil metagenome]
MSFGSFVGWMYRWDAMTIFVIVSCWLLGVVLWMMRLIQVDPTPPQTVFWTKTSFLALVSAAPTFYALFSSYK